MADNSVKKSVRAALKKKQDEVDLLRQQWQVVRDEAQARKDELTAAEADLAEMDAWIKANP